MEGTPVLLPEDDETSGKATSLPKKTTAYLLFSEATRKHMYQTFGGPANFRHHFVKKHQCGNVDMIKIGPVTLAAIGKMWSDAHPTVQQFFHHAAQRHNALVERTEREKGAGGVDNDDIRSVEMEVDEEEEGTAEDDRVTSPAASAGAAADMKAQGKSAKGASKGKQAARKPTPGEAGSSGGRSMEDSGSAEDRKKNNGGGSRAGGSGSSDASEKTAALATVAAATASISNKKKPTEKRRVAPAAGSSASSGGSASSASAAPVAPAEAKKVSGVSSRGGVGGGSSSMLEAVVKPATRKASRSDGEREAIPIPSPQPSPPPSSSSSATAVATASGAGSAAAKSKNGGNSSATPPGGSSSSSSGKSNRPKSKDSIGGVVGAKSGSGGGGGTNRAAAAVQPAPSVTSASGKSSAKAKSKGGGAAGAGDGTAGATEKSGDKSSGSSKSTDKSIKGNRTGSGGSGGGGKRPKVVVPGYTEGEDVSEKFIFGLPRGEKSPVEVLWEVEVQKSGRKTEQKEEWFTASVDLTKSIGSDEIGRPKFRITYARRGSLPASKSLVVFLSESEVQDDWQEEEPLLWRKKGCEVAGTTNAAGGGSVSSEGADQEEEWVDGFGMKSSSRRR